MMAVMEDGPKYIIMNILYCVTVPLSDTVNRELLSYSLPASPLSLADCTPALPQHTVTGGLALLFSCGQAAQQVAMLVR